MLAYAASLLLLYFCCALVVTVDKRYFGTYWTPTPLLLVPFTGVVTIHFLFGEMIGFVALAPEVIAVWIVGSLVFWVAGHGLRQLWTGKPMPAAANRPGDTLATDDIVPWSILGGLVAIIVFVPAYGLMQQSGGLSAIASEDFQAQMGSGWPAHVRTALVAVIVMVLGSAKRWSVPVVVGLLLMLLSILLYQSKGALLAPLIAGALYRVLRGTYVPKFRHLVGAVAGSFLLFQLVYLVGWATLNPSSLFDPNVYAFFSRHFMAYLFSGILGFSESLRLGATWLNADDMMLFAPVYNLVAVVFAFPILDVTALAQDYYVQTAAYGVGSNVNSFFGTIFLAVGPLYGVVVVFAVSLICHAMFLAWTYHPNRWLVVAYCYWGSLLVFGWFDYFFWLLRSIEVPVICLMIAMTEIYLAPQNRPVRQTYSRT